MVDTILAFKDSPASVAAASVLSTLLGGQAKFVSNGEIGHNLSLSRQSLVVLSESQLNTLVKLRLCGFGGPAIVLSSKAIDSLRQRHNILRWGAEAHEAWEISSPLPELLSKFGRLRPLGVDLLKKLRAELEMRPTQLLEHVNSAVKNLQKNGTNFDEKWTKFEAVIDQILQQTPVACHGTTQVGDRGNKTISRHLQELSDEIKQAKKISDIQLSYLREVLEQWRRRVIDSEEAMS